MHKMGRNKKKYQIRQKCEKAKQEDDEATEEDDGR
jgi:hypothetical protein